MVRKLVSFEVYRRIVTDYEAFIKEKTTVSVLYRLDRYEPTFPEIVELKKTIQKDFPEVAENRIRFTPGSLYGQNNHICLIIDIKSNLIGRIKDEIHSR